jgi:hypothetical protein
MGQYDDVDPDYATEDELRGMLDEVVAENVALKRQVKAQPKAETPKAEPKTGLTPAEATTKLEELRGRLARGEQIPDYVAQAIKLARDAGLSVPGDGRGRW